MLGVRIPAATNLSCKTGIDSSIAKRSAIGRVPRVLGDDQHTKMPGVTVGVAAQKTFSGQRPRVPSIGQNLQPFTGHGDVSI